MLIEYILVFCSSLLLALIFTPIVKFLATKLKLVDTPDYRKIHKQPVPRLGGIAIYLSFAITVLLFHKNEPLNLYILMVSSFIFLLGILDDIFQIKARYKLFFLIIIAFITADSIFGFGITMKQLSLPGNGFVVLGMMAIPFSMLWLLGITNAVNLIDGMDGLASGITIIVAISIAVNAWLNGTTEIIFLIAVLVGSALGFLRYNYFPAKIFMGDSGSLFLGFMLAVISLHGVLKGSTAISMAIPLMALGLPVYDTFTSITRRLKAGQPIFYPDSNHLHHRINKYGFSHKQVVLIMYFETIILSIGSVIINITIGITSYIVLAILCVLIFIVYKIIKKKYQKYE